MHKAIIAKIEKTEEIAGANNVQIGYALGERVVISKEWDTGTVGVLFPAGLQLSEKFCYENNLHRDKSKNKDKEKAGFFENTRRVRVQPFLKVKSEAFFTSLNALHFTGYDVNTLEVGAQFDSINGVDICCRYVSDKVKLAKGNSAVKPAKKNYAPLFHKHVDTEQFRHYAESIPVGSVLYFHAKVHGTSHRQAHTKVVTGLPWWKRQINKVFPVFNDWEWKHVLGTRNVVFKDSDTDKTGFHGSEQFRFDAFEFLKPYVEKGMTIYGEIAGFANGKPIMPVHSVKGLKNKDYEKKYGKDITYTYGCKEHENRLHVYRISYVTEDGKQIDMPQKQMEAWCQQRGILCTIEVHPPMIYNGDVEALRTLVEELTERPDSLTEDYIDPSHVSEGIIIRVENDKPVPDFYKSKSYAFKVMEGLVSDETADTEEMS